MAAGAVLVTVGKRWTVRKATVVADQFAPTAVGKRMATGVSQRVDAARREGRAAMADTEERLRARLRDPVRVGSGRTDSEPTPRR